jgi:hypothetical protein
MIMISSPSLPPSRSLSAYPGEHRRRRGRVS